jgi:hypothetical protein
VVALTGYEEEKMHIPRMSYMIYSKLGIAFYAVFY